MKLAKLITVIILIFNCAVSGWAQSLSAPGNSTNSTVDQQTETSSIIGSELIANKQWLARLEQQGFFAALPISNQIYLHYLDHRLPAFVTADSVLRTYQIIYQEALVQLEEASAEKLLLLTRRLSERISAGLTTLPPAKTRAVLEKNLAVWQLINALFNDAERAQLPVTVVEELQLIEQASTKQSSPLLGVTIDYREFQLPAGLSRTRQSYTRAINWLDDWAITLETDEGARETLLLLNEFVFDEPLVKLWQEIEAPRHYLYGSAETALLPQLIPTVKYILGRALISSAEIGDAQVATFRRLLTRLEAPHQRFKLFTRGQSFESVVRSLIAAGRPFGGLDLALLLGADVKSSEAGQTEEKVERARQALTVWQLRNSASYQSRLLDCYRALLKPATDRRVPDFARQPAWRDRMVTALLSSWAAHYQPSLPAIKSSRGNANSTAYRENFHGYIEPNIAFFYQLHAMAEGLREQLGNARVRVEPLSDFIELIDMLQRMVEKELAAIEFSEAEIDLLENYGEQLARLSFVDGNYQEITAEQGSITAISNGSNQLLNLVVGRSMTLYVVVVYREKRYLCRGGVSSYYQTGGMVTIEAISGQPLILPYQQSYLLLGQE